MIHVKKRRQAVLLLAAALTIFLLGQQPASAATADQCATNLSATPGTTATHCFTTFSAAISYATAGRVQLANASTARPVSAAELGQPSAAQISPDTSYVLSIGYKSTGFGGASQSFYASGVCGSWQLSTMPSGWNDAIQSIANYSGCAATLYANGPFGPPVYDTGVNASVSTLGSFNKQTSSIKWCTYYGCT